MGNLVAFHCCALKELGLEFVGITSRRVLRKQRCVCPVNDSAQRLTRSIVAALRSHLHILLFQQNIWTVELHFYSTLNYESVLLTFLFCIQ